MGAKADIMKEHLTFLLCNTIQNQEWVSGILNIGLKAVICVWATKSFLEMLLGKKHPIRFWGVLIVFHKYIIDVILVSQMKNYVSLYWCMNFTVIEQILYLIVLMAVLMKISSCSLEKCLLGMVIADGVAQICYTIASYPVYYLMQREIREIFEFIPIQASDYLVAALHLLAVLIAMHYLHPLFETYRKVQDIPWWLSILSLAIYEYFYFSYYWICSGLDRMWNSKLLEMAYLLFIPFVVFGIGVIYYMISAETRFLRKRHQFLSIQRRLMDEYMNKVLQQQEQARNYRKEIDLQIQRMNSLENPFAEREVKIYLSTLYKEYEELKKYDVCDNLLVNSFVAQKEECLTQKGITAVWNFEDIPKEEEKLQKCLMLLDQMIGEGIACCERQTRKEQNFLKVWQKQVKKQWCLQIQYPDAKKRVWKVKMDCPRFKKSYVRKEKRENGTVTVTILL